MLINTLQLEWHIRSTPMNDVKTLTLHILYVIMGTPENDIATRIVDQMFNNDAFSQWLGIKRISESPGRSVLQMTIRAEMLNGFHILHGGVTYSLADSAFAFASNSHGRKSVSIETSISHLVSCKEGDILTAEAIEIHKGNKTALYEVIIKNQENVSVAVFKGTVYRTSKNWFDV